MQIQHGKWQSDKMIKKIKEKVTLLTFKKCKPCCFRDLNRVVPLALLLVELLNPLPLFGEWTVGITRNVMICSFNQTTVNLNF